ncbi:hypothetical protein [Leifsonia virtsii]|uniref:Uncharacterized protein n=1 Tax=Leifsonia virtsii TaxID=3035915 RepID=A0ABT8IZ25_9MICO|nr:hypothetical protein [Leifsonia virtsii]MDN4598073.1 hypothetical protein [Leifsonia virtsii]
MTLVDDRPREAPVPLVTWQAVVRANEPSSNPTRARYRTVKGHGRATEGVRVQRRADGRAQGTDTVHSVLGVIAAYARRAQLEELSEALLDEARILEERYAHAVGSLEEGDSQAEADLYREMSSATLEALRAHESGWSSILAYAVVTSADARSAHIEEVEAEGDLGGLDLPRALLDYWSISDGDGLWLFCEIRQSSAIFEVLPTARSQVERLERQAFLRSVRPERDEAERERVRRLAETGAVGRRSVRRPA